MKHYLSLVKFGHTVFALPFALVGYFLGVMEAGRGVEWHLLLLVLLCMVFARTAAMAFNRYADRDIDAQNSRTLGREIPAGIISPGAAMTLVVFCSTAFIATTWLINALCFALSPLALAVVLGYSFTKRFTAWSHFILGVGLALAPVGAYLAVTAYFSVIPILLGCVVLLWVGGFDIIYAMQDIDFDKERKLHSFPVRLGPSAALQGSGIAHILCAAALIIAVLLIHQKYQETSWLLFAGTGLFLSLLVYQHRLVRPHDMSRVNLAFFTTNGVASVLFGLAFILDFYL